MSDLLHIVHTTPLGDVLVVVRGEGIVALHPLTGRMGDALAHEAARLGAASEPGETTASAAARSQLDEYFAGLRREFDLPLDWSGVGGFTRRALEAVLTIPYGETAGYGEVAVMAGSPGAARAVGTACATTPFSIVVPVHRVVRADGSLGEYGGHPEIKARLLALEEDVTVQAGRTPVG